MKVIIIGGIHHNTLGVVRSIGSAGISSEDIALFIVDEHGGKKDFVSKSKYLKKSTIRYLKTYDEILEALYRIADKNEKKAIIEEFNKELENLEKEYEEERKVYFDKRENIQEINASIVLSN